MLYILTACYRNLNLPFIADSIKKNLKYKDYKWIICNDQFNCKNPNQMGIVLNYIQQLGLKYDIINTGRNNSKNYGGDMYNDALIKIARDYKDKDAWIYILDDDNLLHPRFGSLIGYSIEFAKQNNKQIIWFNKLGSTGLLDWADKFIHIEENKSKTYWIPTTLPDPSQIVVNLELYLNSGLFPPGSNYDYKYIIPLFKKHEDQIAYFEDIKHTFLRGSHQCYHNGLRSTSDIMDALSRINSDDSIETHISIGGLTETISEFPVPKEYLIPVLNQLLNDKLNKYKQLGLC